MTEFINFRVSLLCILHIISLNVVGAKENISDKNDRHVSLTKEQEKVDEILGLFNIKSKRETSYILSHFFLKKMKTDVTKAQLTHLISSYFIEYKKNADSALIYSKKTLELVRLSNNPKAKYIELLGIKNLARAYLKVMGLTKQSKKVTIEGIRKAKRWKIVSEYDYLMYHLAEIYIFEKDFDKAIPILEYTKQSSVDFIKKSSLIALGKVDTEQGNYAASNIHLKQALSLTNSSYYTLLIQLYIVENSKYLIEDYDVIRESKRLINIGEESGNLNFENIVNKVLIDEYITSFQYKEAEKVLFELLEDRKKEGNLNDILYCYSKLRNIFKSKENFKKALQYSEFFWEIKDSINALQKARELKEVEIEFEILKMDKENFELKKEKIEQTYVKKQILMITVILILVIFGLIAGYYLKLTEQKTLSNEKINSLMKEQELKLIKATIIGQDRERSKLAKGLHDALGNDIVTLKLFAGEIKALNIEKIQDLIDTIYQKVRGMSHNIIPKKNRQQEYVEVLEEYIKNIDEVTDISFKFITNANAILNQLSSYIQYEIFVILKELITNTLKHAEAKEVIIVLESFSDIIMFSYEDDGKGFSLDAKQKNKGIGLTNIKDRIEELSGSLIIDSYPKRGTLVKVEIGLNQFNH